MTALYLHREMFVWFDWMRWRFFTSDVNRNLSGGAYRYMARRRFVGDRVAEKLHAIVSYGDDNEKEPVA